MERLAFSSLMELADGLRAGAYSSVELTEYYLARIARLNERAHAYVDVYGESALKQAQFADLQRRSGASLSDLHGLPIAIKDLCEIAGQITTGGSLAWRKRRSDITCTAVERLEAAGMVVLGKTHMSEFAFGSWGTNTGMGTPRNPWSWSGVHHAPGGSSSGSGVAVAAGLTPVAIATDTGGSARIPASFNGLTGLKPTHGLISLHGILPLAPSLDSVGTITRTAEDAAILMDVLAIRPSGPKAVNRTLEKRTPDRRNWTASGLRIAVLSQDEYPELVDDEVQAVTHNAARAFRELGGKVETVSIPVNLRDLMRRFSVISTAEAYEVHREYINDPHLPIDPWVRSRIAAGASITAEAYQAEQSTRKLAIDSFNRWMEAYDVLLTPTLPWVTVPTEDIDEDRRVSPFTRPANYLATCAISLPAGFSAGGLPIGVQLIGKPWGEDTLLLAASAFQQETDWHTRKPADVG
ncbi:amidase [Burkholderia sp. MR1-5-21]